MILTEAAVRDCINFFKGINKALIPDERALEQADNQLQDVLLKQFYKVDTDFPVTASARKKRLDLISQGATFPRSSGGKKYRIQHITRWKYTGYYYRTLLGARSYKGSPVNFRVITQESAASKEGFVFTAKLTGNLYRLTWFIDKTKFYKEYPDKIELPAYTIFDAIDNSDLINIYDTVLLPSIQSNMDYYFR